MRRAWHVVFAGGGTGGHLFPGLAVAEQLAALCPDVRITFFGCGKPLEQQAVRAAGHRYVSAPAHPLPDRLAQWPRFLRQMLAGCRAAGRLLVRHQVTAVVGLGGYASVPAAWAARRLGVPVVLLEQNAVPGRATRWLSRWAAIVCAGFELARWRPPRRTPLQVTGNPVRGAIVAAAEAHPGRLGQHPPQLLVVGGSSGAQVLNRCVPRALARIRPAVDGWEIVHQSGYAERRRTEWLYARLGLPATVVPFIDQMAPVLVRSTLAIARAGGTTLAELAVAGLPAVLIPYPFARDDHQRANADRFAAAAAAVVLDQRQLADSFESRLGQVVRELVCDSGRRSAMAGAMKRLARPDAAWRVAQVVLRVCQQGVPATTAAAA